MRLTGGAWRGRRLCAPVRRGLRPTSARVRQALFDTLAHGALAHGALAHGPLRTRPEGGFAGLRVLDAFAGTGALALEALSRGASQAVLLDTDPATVAALKRLVATLGLHDAARVLRADATRPPPPPPGFAADLVFLDPPYRRALAGPAIAALAGRAWLVPGALAVIESPARGEPGDPAPPPGFTPRDERRYGDTRLTFLEWTAEPD